MANNEDPKKKPSGPPQVSDLILGGLKPRTGKETSKWIAGLADHAVKEAAEAAAREMDQPTTPSGSHHTLRGNTRQAVISYLDQIFDFFQQYEYDFNKTGPGIELAVSIERPTYLTEHVKQRFTSSEPIKVFRGRISTRYWTLILRACNEVVEGWIMPVEQLFAFRADDEMNPPIVVIEPVANKQGDLAWRVNNTECSWDQTRVLAKQLFGWLIRVARGEAGPSQPFSILLNQDGRTTGEVPISQLPAQGQPPPPPGFPGNSGFSGNVGFPGNNAPPFQSPGSSGTRRSLELQTLDSEPPTPPKSPKTTQRTAARKAAAAAAAEREVSIDGVIEQLNLVVNKELEKLSGQGAAAFSQQDLAAVEQVFRRTTRVKELQGQINQIMLQWKQAMKDALEN